MARNLSQCVNKRQRSLSWGHERRLTHPATTSAHTLNAEIFLHCNMCSKGPEPDSCTAAISKEVDKKSDLKSRHHLQRLPRLHLRTPRGFEPRHRFRGMAISLANLGLARSFSIRAATSGCGALALAGWHSRRPRSSRWRGRPAEDPRGDARQKR